MTVFRHLFIAVVTLGLIWLTPAIGCGLHGSIDWGFEVSYPGALRIAMAVAKAHRDGLLLGVNRSALHRNAQFDQMLADNKEVKVMIPDTAEREVTEILNRHQPSEIRSTPVSGD